MRPKPSVSWNPESVSLVLTADNLLMGDAEHIASQMQQMSAAGVDGLLLTWTEPQSGIRKFRKDVLPRLTEAGLREAG